MSVEILNLKFAKLFSESKSSNTGPILGLFVPFWMHFSSLIQMKQWKFEFQNIYKEKIDQASVVGCRYQYVVIYAYGLPSDSAEGYVMEGEKGN